MAAEELRPGETVEFGASRMSSVRVHDMQQLGYFVGGVAHVLGMEEVPEQKAIWLCSRVFSLLAFVCPHIDLWEKSCVGSTSRSTS